MYEIDTWPLEIETLLQPITPEQPSGESLRYDETYDRIKEARREDDPSLSQGVWQRELKRADWYAVSALCIEALTTRTKDLQIAAWLLESWLHLYGMAGVRDGLIVMVNLCEQFWPTLYPELTAGNVDARTAPIVWINERLFLTLKQIPITQPETNDAVAYTWLDWENALYLEQQAKKYPSLLRVAETDQQVTKARFRESLDLSSTAVCVGLLEQTNDALDALDDLDTVLRVKCTDQSPSLTQFKTVLVNIRQLLTSVLAERNGGSTIFPAEPDKAQSKGMLVNIRQLLTSNRSKRTDGASALVAQPGSAQGGGSYITGDIPIHSRTEAYQLLAMIAEYLTTIEPHSPTPYLIRRAVTWGSMPLNELLMELLKDGGDLASIYTLLGMKQGDD
ncbi:MAG TPA: type VI secretion system protein TssA [Herpetosiphonaceae bacterium]